MPAFIRICFQVVPNLEVKCFKVKSARVRKYLTLKVYGGWVYHSTSSVAVVSFMLPLINPRKGSQIAFE
jgi:hypothetical protein